MFEPRFYQDDCLRVVHRVRIKGITRVLAVMASGLGKTVTMAIDARRFRTQFPKTRVLYLCNRNQILHQAKATFEAENGSGCTYGFFHGTEKTVHSVDFLFASLQTMRKHMKRFRPDEFDYVVVDESHHTYGDTYLDVVTYWKPKFLLGMTATPDRTDGQDIRRVFGQEVFYLPLEEALAQGLLTPVDYRLMTDEIQLTKKIESNERRISVAMINRTVFVPKRDAEIIRIIKKHEQELDQRRTIIFCRSVPYCNHLAGMIDGAMPIHAKIPIKERIVRVEMFRQGIISTLLVVDCFNEGIDIPEANMLVFLRDTDSHVVFFQQLGRGLRLSDGKDKVIVLDFVGSCERVKTVYTLWDEVRERRDKILKTTAPALFRKRHALPQNVDPFYLNVGTVNFQEKVMKIIDVIRRIHDGYTRDECIDMLRAFAKKLGGSPTQREVHRNRSMPSLGMYTRYFGTFTSALQAAGLVVNQFQDVPEEVLLEQLRTLQKKLKHPPSQRELGQASKDGLCCSEPVFRERFGSLNEALKKVGSTPSRQVGFTKTELIAQLHKLKDTLGRVPTVDDLAEASARNETASYTVFFDRFGSWGKALHKAKLRLKVETVPRYANEQVLKDVHTAHRILGRAPTTGDMDRLRRQGKLKVGSLQPFYSRFKTWDKVLKAAKLK